MVEQTQKAEDKADEVEREVIGPLRKTRARFEYNHLAHDVAVGLGIIRTE